MFTFAPDGQTLLMEVPRYTVGWVEPETGRIVRRLPTVIQPCEVNAFFRQCAHAPFAASLSANGTRIAVNIYPSEDKTRPRVLVYNAASTRLLSSADLERGIATLSPDGRTLLVQSYGPDVTVLEARPLQSAKTP